MKTIYVKHPHRFSKEQLPKMAMALGYFDGVHYGHQKVIKTAKQFATEHNMKSAVMTFHPHPSVILGKKNQHVKYITPLKDKERMIADLGIDVLYIIEFDHQFAHLLPQQFVDMYLINLNIKHIVAGFDFSYGRLGKGTMETMPFHSRGEFTQTTIDKVSKENEKISSTYIRNKIQNGEVSDILHLMGRFYSVTGTVVDGDKRGRTIGFPTANVSLIDEYLIPAIGVYAVRIKVNEVWHNAVCNIGYKPTFNGETTGQPTIEVHILDFDGQIYGQTVIVEWHKRIRNEQKFANIDDLIQQIQQDKQQAAHYFEKNAIRLAF